MTDEVTFWEAVAKLKIPIFIVSGLIIVIAGSILVGMMDMEDKLDDHNAHLVYNFCDGKSGMQPIMLDCQTGMINCSMVTQEFEKEYNSGCRIKKDMPSIPELVEIQ